MTRKEKWIRYEKRWKWRDFYFNKCLRRHGMLKYFHREPVMPHYAKKWVMSSAKTNDQKGQICVWRKFLNDIILHKLKNAGKQAIHLGGATQLLFGIKGYRWEHDYPTKIATFFNDAWTRALAESIVCRSSIHNDIFYIFVFSIFFIIISNNSTKRSESIY